MKKFSVSCNEYEKGLLYIQNDGVVIYDPEASETELAISSGRARGYELVGFKFLIEETLSQGIKFTQTSIVKNTKDIDPDDAKKHHNLTLDVIKKVSELIVNNSH